MEIREPINAGDYHDRDIKAAFVALIEQGQILKPFDKSYVIVGVSFPWLLLDHGKPPHLGTLDIDIGLNPEDLDDGQYATLVETLERAGYRRDLEGLKPFQLLKLVDTHDGGDPVPVIVDLLVMKGYALSGRDKMKDAYDIYYSVRNYPGGPAKLAEDCKPLLTDPIAAEGFRLLASKFREREDVVGICLDDLFGDAFLATHRIAGDDATAQLKDAQKLGDGGDLVGLLTDLVLAYRRRF